MSETPTSAEGRAFAVAVVVLSFALLLADFVCRSLLVPAFPLVEREWELSDTQLGALAGVVALVVGVLAVPLSVLGDRIGRARAVQGMALVWSLAMVGCALAANYPQLLAWRAVLGVGEAAYASVGLALVLTVVPASRRGSVIGGFLAGASVGAALGVALGGVLATALGWRWSLGVVGLLSLVLVALHRLVVSDRKVALHRAPGSTDGAPGPADGSPARWTGLLRSPPLVCAYLASGLQLLPAGALLAWLPTYLAGVYGLPTTRAALLAAAALLSMALGMVGCGWASDRLSRRRPIRRWTTAVAFSLASLGCLGTAFALGPGWAQLAFLALGAFFVAGPASVAGALVTYLAPESIRATALGALALANNLLGLAAGPVVVGLLADRLGLVDAMRLVPLASVVVLGLFWTGRRLDASAAEPAARPTADARTVRGG